MALPNPGMTIDPARTALLITDPQNDFLSPDGVTWSVVGKSVTENNTVENIERLFKAAKENDIQVFIAIIEEGDGYQAALVNFRFIANTVWTTDEAVEVIKQSRQESVTA